jgi:hypothetical protein
VIYALCIYGFLEVGLRVGPTKKEIHPRRKPAMFIRKLAAWAAAIGLNVCPFAIAAADTPLGNGLPSYDGQTDVLTLPALISSDGTNYYNLKVRIKQLEVVDPGLSNNCPVDGVQGGYPLNYSCTSDFATTLALLQGSWTGNNASKGRVKITIDGKSIAGTLATFTDSTSQKAYSQCSFSGVHAAVDGETAGMNYIFRFTVPQLNCAEGIVNINSGAATPGMGERFASTILYAVGGRNKVDALSITFSADANGDDALTLHKQ